MDPTVFTKILALWPGDEQLAGYEKLARDMGVPSNRARQWINRGYLAPWYWLRLVEVLRQKFGRRVTYRQLVEATVALRGDAPVIGASQAVGTRRRNRENKAAAAKRRRQRNAEKEA